MSKLMLKLWKDDAGALIAAEYLFVATILVIGIVVGLANVRDAVVAELTELGQAYLALSQGYSIAGTVNGCTSASTDGTGVSDISNADQLNFSHVPVVFTDIDQTPCGN